MLAELKLIQFVLSPHGPVQYFAIKGGVAAQDPQNKNEVFKDRSFIHAYTAYIAHLLHTP